LTKIILFARESCICENKKKIKKYEIVLIF